MITVEEFVSWMAKDVLADSIHARRAGEFLGMVCGWTYGEDGVADIVRDDQREGKMGHVRLVDERDRR